MNWYLLFFVVMGLGLAIVPDIIMKKIKQGAKLDGAECHAKYNSASFWLLVFGWLVYFISLGSITQFYFMQEGEIEKLERRIEVLEAVPKVDTIHINDIRLP